MTSGQFYNVQTRADYNLRCGSELALCAASSAAERTRIAECYIARAARSEAEIAFLIISSRIYSNKEDAQGDLIALVCKVVERLSPFARGAGINVEQVVVLNYLARLKELPPITVAGGNA